MKYKKLRDELLEMLEQDQREIQAQSRLYKQLPKASATRASRKRLTERCLERASRMLKILDTIGEATITNVGKEELEAMTVLALHSKYRVMKKVLDALAAAYEKNLADTFIEGIPALTDRILLIERKEQRFGTQWLTGADGNFFFAPVEDFKNMNRRRATYGLGKARHPRDFTYGIPKGPTLPETRASDQRQPTSEEYDQFSELLD